MSYTRWVPPPTPMNFCMVAAKHATALGHLDSIAPNAVTNISNTPSNSPATAENRIVINKLDYIASTISYRVEVGVVFNDLPAVQEIIHQLANRDDFSEIRVENTQGIRLASYNATLSLKRAQAVAEPLLKSGIPASDISTVGMGEAHPIADNATEEGCSENRRVAIIVVP